MADAALPIKVKLDITVGKEIAFSENVDFQVDGACIVQIVVPIGEKGVDVSVAPDVAEAIDFQFLVVRPLLLGTQPIKAADLIEKSKLTDDSKAKDEKPTVKHILEYGIPIPNRDQRKPLRGTHVFAAGQTEWMTDMLKNGAPGGLTKLRFWNSKKAASTDDLTETEKEKLFKDDKRFQDSNGKKKEGEAFKLAEQEWAKGRHDITVQIVAGFTPTVAS